MKGNRFRFLIALALFTIGCALMGSGFWIRHKVNEQPVEGFDLGEFGLAGIKPFTEITEKDLLQDATSTGVIRKDGELYSTYDRTQARGKRACPS